ncbi:MAG: hypothetical protein GC161_08665 [Planctomycetaceae bacterium]|nr:hypothetical protein [Planctomycetaceae bacterium]
MGSSLSLLALLLAAASAQDFELDLPTDTVPFGAAFDLTVRRQVPLGEVFGEFDTSRLAPLALELVDVRRDEHDGLRRESLRFSARAFALGDVRIGPEPAAVLHVTSSLGQDDDGRMELALQPIGPPKGRWREALFGLGALLALALFFWQRHRSAAAPEPQMHTEEPPTPDPCEEALAALAQLGRAEDEAGRRREVATAADCVRRAVGAIWSVPAEPSTSAELLAHLGRARAPQTWRKSLRALLGDADRVKFARAGADVAARDAYLKAARQVLEQTVGPGGDAL